MVVLEVGLGAVVGSKLAIVLAYEVGLSVTHVDFEVLVLVG